ncbi:MAG TPA: hypothetical protein PLP42_18585 [Acidobacteriota bacterium]|nr:hypothetical protein [Acidobacteriota bacterium]
MNYGRFLLCAVLILSTVPVYGGRILLRWDLESAPPPGLAGVSGLAVPWAVEKTALVHAAIDAGYKVYYLAAPEDLAQAIPVISAGRASGIIIVSRDRQAALQAEIQVRPQIPASLELSIAWETELFPGILSNSIRQRDGVLQVAAASAQPWIESNQAAARILKFTYPRQRFLHYAWPEDSVQPVLLEDYLLAVAEAGACGIDLILPLTRDFQQALLRRVPQAVDQWRQVAACIQVYSRHGPQEYQHEGNVIVCSDDFDAWFDLLKMLSRYSIPFQLSSRSELKSLEYSRPGLLLFLATPNSSEIDELDALLRRNVSVIVALENGERTAWPPNLSVISESEEAKTYRAGESQLVELYGSGIDPNALALDVRRMLGKDGRIIQLWNAPTVMASLYRQDDSTVVLYLVNYALSPQLVQARIAGAFSKVECLWPEEGKTGTLDSVTDQSFTEVNIPDVKVGAIVYLKK